MIAAAVAALGWGAGALRAAAPNGNYRLAFDDEFNGTSLDTSKWAAASPSWTMPNIASTATASDVNVANGMLTLTATGRPRRHPRPK